MRNLFTITEYSGLQPGREQQRVTDSATRDLGTDFYAYPLARTFSFGIQAAW